MRATRGPESVNLALVRDGVMSHLRELGFGSVLSSELGRERICADLISHVGVARRINRAEVSRLLFSSSVLVAQQDSI